MTTLIEVRCSCKGCKADLCDAIGFNACGRTQVVLDAPLEQLGWKKLEHAFAGTEWRCPFCSGMDALGNEGKTP